MGGDFEKKEKERKENVFFFITRRLKVKISAKRFFFIFSECFPNVIETGTCICSTFYICR